MTVERVERVVPDGLSPSSLELWLQCRRRFEGEKIFGERSPGGVDALLGTFVHRVLELLFERPVGERSLVVARGLLRSEWSWLTAHEDWSSLGLVVGSEGERSFRRRAWASVRGYFEIEDPDGVVVLATERFVSAVVDGVPLRGIVDRVDRDVFDDVVVADYKTGKVPAPAFRAPKFRQLNLYALLLREVDGVQPGEGRLLFTSHGKVLATSFSPESLSTAWEVAADAWDGLALAERSGVFPADPGPLCGWCPFVARCDVGLAEVRERRAARRLKASAPAYALAGEVEVEVEPWGPRG